MLDRRRFLALSATAAASVAGAVLSATLLPGCTWLSEALGRGQTVTDDAGRLVTLPAPDTLKSIYFTSPLAQVFCFTLAPEYLAGTCIRFREEQLEFLPVGTESLEYLGTINEGGVIEAQMLREKDVQVIFSISGTRLTDENVSDALGLEDASGVPVFLVDGSFERIGDAYRLLGQCLGRNERAERLAGYCEDIYARVSSALAAIPASDLVRYYYAEGSEGLLTEPDSSQHSLAFQVARGINVAGHMGLGTEQDVLVPVSSEQIVEWDPDFIITGTVHGQATPSDVASLMRASSVYAETRAVRNGRVLCMPSLPFAFCDRPPGVNRFLGIQWLANLFYPDCYQVDMVEVVRDFYATCYWRDLSRDQARRILEG
jgi:iron complex transport system substrate-binding protein